MDGSLPFKIQIIANGNLELILTSRRSKIARSYLHPLNREEAERFANTLEAALASGAYTDLDCCPLCGEPFTRQNRLCLLHGGRVIHKKCLCPAVNAGALKYSDCNSSSKTYSDQKPARVHSGHIPWSSPLAAQI